MNETIFFKNCKTCGEKKFYKNANSYRANKYKISECKKCADKTRSQKTKNRPRPPFTEEWKQNIAIGHKKSEVWKASMNTLEYKEKHRQVMLKMIRDGKSKVAFNSKACEVFDFINQKLQWNGLHAKNGKEQVVDVFFLDYYDPSLNIAIEWDEKHHRKPSRHRGDWFKQKVVLDTIGCEFYRVDEVSKIVKKVDKLQIDRTKELQQVINEYYENKK